MKNLSLPTKGWRGENDAIWLLSLGYKNDVASVSFSLCLSCLCLFLCFSISLVSHSIHPHGVVRMPRPHEETIWECPSWLPQLHLSQQAASTSSHECKWAFSWDQVPAGEWLPRDFYVLVPKACEYSPFHSRRTTHGIRVVDFEREREQPGLHRCAPHLITQVCISKDSFPRGWKEQQGDTGRDMQQRKRQERFKQGNYLSKACCCYLWKWRKGLPSRNSRRERLPTPVF